MYINLNLTYDFKKEKEKDSLISFLNESSYGIDFGYNVYKSRRMVISPYTGLRLHKYKHITTGINKEISMKEYKQSKELNLKVYQFSCPVGINSTFYYGEQLNFGCYFAYRFNLHSIPIVRTHHHKIQSEINSPLGNYMFGLGMGIGFNSL